MSALARTALRLAGIEALKADPVIAALCGPRIFDSRIETLAESEPVPVITVLTEEMEGDAWSANNGGPPFDDHCELVIEIAMRAMVQADGAAPAIATPETDAELEAQLDLLEQRAVEALTVATTAQSELVRDAVTRRVSKQKSARFVEAETGIKLAVRLVTLTAELKGEDQLDATFVAGPLVAAAAAGGNVGNGTLGLSTPPADDLVEVGAYTVTLVSATEYTVTNPGGMVTPAPPPYPGAPRGPSPCQVGRPYAGTGIRFEIVAGTTPFAAGDRFTVTVTQGPFAGLPDPLRTVCDAMTPGSTGYGICQMITGALPRPGAPFFTGVDMTYAPQIQLDPVVAPLQPGDVGASPTFGESDNVKS